MIIPDNRTMCVLRGDVIGLKPVINAYAPFKNNVPYKKCFMDNEFISIIFKRISLLTNFVPTLIFVAHIPIFSFYFLKIIPNYRYLKPIKCCIGVNWIRD